MNKFRFVDLFAGIGGFHFGLEASGGDCVYANEWDPFAAKTYREWTGLEPDQRDIRSIDYANQIPDHDVLAGGFPCQPFSLAGVSKKNSLGRSHGFQDLEQGNLFFAICDIVAAKKPKIILLENVKNLRSHDGGKTWSVIEDSLDKLGYHLTWKVIDAKHWVPQHRERVFIIGLRKDLWSESEAAVFKFPSHPDAVSPRLEAILDPLPESKVMLSERLWAYLQDYAAKHKARGNGFGYSIADPKGHTRTLSARYHKDGSEILIRQDGWLRPRRLTVREARRLMGFDSELVNALGRPVAFPQVVSDTQAYKQLGNSVCPLVVREIGKQITHYLERQGVR